MNVQSWTFVMVGLSFGLYLWLAFRARVRDTQGFYVAGRGVPASLNGMATAADWMSAASFLSMAGTISLLGYAGGVYLMGWTGGFVLLAVLLAPYLRKFGHFTVPDFVGDRFESRTARFVALACALFISFTYVAGQMRGVGIVFARFLEVDVDVGVVVGMVLVFVYSTLGGMKGITWTQIAQYWVLILAYVIPVAAISWQLTGQPVPQVGMGGEVGTPPTPLLAKLDALHRDLGFASYTEAFTGSWDRVNVFATALALMVGTAGLPHVIVRFYTVKNVAAARWSGFWALLFIAALYTAAPATAAFARYYVIESLHGKTASELPGWFHTWSRTGLVLWLDDGDGKLAYHGPAQQKDNELFRIGAMTATEFGDLRASHERWLATSGREGADGRVVLTAKKLAGPDADILVLAAPEMAQLAAWIIALVAAGGLAAALSTASGLLLVISSSVAHDFYFKLLRPQASEQERLRLSRLAIGVAVVIAGVVGIFPPGFVAETVAFAFGLAASSFFPVLVLGIFSKRVGTVPAVAGMLAGIAFTGSYILGTVYFGWSRWCFGIGPQGIGAVGMFVNFAVALLLTPCCAGPSPAAAAMVDRVRDAEVDGAEVTADLHG
ncbi:MAG: sodium:solute symporter family protein [Planctomycetota bacterium]